MLGISHGKSVAAIALMWALWLPVPAFAQPVLDAVRGIERDLNARVGFFMHDLQTGEVISYAADDRFPLNSTFKLLACGALLNRVESGGTSLADRVPLQNVEIERYSPAVRDHIRAGKTEVSLNDACAMMLSVSDNTAANIVLADIGGPEGLTAFLRSIGDSVSRLDRWEPELNEALPGDPRDTTTPRAIAGAVRALVVDEALMPASREVLLDWLSAHSVADALFRAALPGDWTIYDRTGAGGYGSRSIVAVIYPPRREPVIAALFMTETKAGFARRNEAAASVGAAIVAHIAAQ